MFYVYEWYIENTGEVIYVGKGCNRRYKVTKHNRLFNELTKRYKCNSRIIKTFDSEEEAFAFEFVKIKALKEKGQCVCNIRNGGYGGTTEWWTQEKREWYSKNNAMLSSEQRQRMKDNNPMKREDVKKRVAAQKTKAVVINGTEYDCAKNAAIALSVCTSSIYSWCKRGYNTQGEPCRYKNEPPKEYPSIKTTHPKVTSCRPVVIDGIRFETVKDAASKIGVWPDTLIRAIKHSGFCKGHKCEYDNQQPSHTKSDNSSMEGSTTNR